MEQLRIVKEEAKTAKILHVKINTEKRTCIKNWATKGIQKW